MGLRHWLRERRARRALSRLQGGRAGGILVVDLHPGGNAELTEAFVADRKGTMIAFRPPLKTTLSRLFGRE